MDAARQTFRQLLMPAIIALLADLVGFITILLIPVQVVQEMAVTASIGVAIVILTDLVLLPVLVSWVKWDDQYRARVEVRQAKLAAHWQRLARITERKPAADHHRRRRGARACSACGRAARRPSATRRRACPSCARIHATTATATSSRSKFSIGVDILTVIVETKEPACTSHDLMTAIDTFAWKMRNVDGVQEVMTLPHRREDRDRRLERRQPQVAQHPARAEPAHAVHALHRDQHGSAERGLQRRCPVMLFLRDHKAETIERVVAEVKAWRTLNTFRRRDVQSRHRQRRRDGGDQRGSGGEGISDPRLGVRGRDPHVPADLPQPARAPCSCSCRSRWCRCWSTR